MGCANAKPQAHTKKPELNSNNNVNPSQTGKPIQNPNIPSQPLPNSKDKVPLRQQNAQAARTMQKSSLSDIQRNPNLTKGQQVRVLQVNPKQQQVNPFVQQPIKQSASNLPSKPIPTNNKYFVPLAENQALPQTKPPSIQNNTPPPKQTFANFNSNITHNLSTIKEGRQESEETRRIEPSTFQPFNKKDDIRISNLTLSPRMDQNCLVSNISKPTQSPAKTLFENENSYKGSEIKMERKIVDSSEKKQHPMISVIPPTLSPNKNLENEAQNVSKSRIKDKSSSLIKNEYNDHTTQEIKMNVHYGKKSSQFASTSEEFFIPIEENFDSSCSFSINNLIVDMNKITW